MKSLGRFSDFILFSAINLLVFLVTGCQADNKLRGFLGIAKSPKPTALTLIAPLSSPSTTTTPTIEVGGVSNGSTVKIFSDSSCITEVATGTATGATIGLTLSAPLVDGAYTFYANQNDGRADSNCSTASVSYIVDTVISTVSLSPIYSEDAESNAAKSFTVNISPVKPFDVNVSYDLYGSTAISGTHYNGITGSVVIPANQSSAIINYNLLENALADGRKMLQVFLNRTDATMSQLGSLFQARSYISDNDAATETAVKITTGGDYSCAITSADVLKCWGRNSSGQLGDGTTTNRLSPVIVDSGTSYVAIAAGYAHSCGITTVGVLKCWGWNGYGMLGDGTTTNRLSPVIINAGTSYVAVSAGVTHTCGITTTGILKCWGRNNSGQLGDGTTTQRTSPVAIDGGTSYSAVAAGGVGSFDKEHSCGITTAGVLKCWGVNGNGQLGDGTTTQRNSPVIIESGITYSTISAGANYTCGITTAGALKCWGLNDGGQLGDGTMIQRLLPVIIDSGTNYSVIAASFADSSQEDGHTCGITTAGVLKCWGRNEIGQLGDGTSSYDNKLSPFIIDPGTNYLAVAVTSIDTQDYGHTCGITTAGSLKCWGDNRSGQLGDGIGANPPMPAPIDTGVSYSSVAVGGAHSCGVTVVANTLKCWGSNSTGQVGDDTTTQRKYPVPIENSISYSSVAAGNDHTCGVTTAGVLKCWGYNSRGQLGDGTTTQNNSPVIVDGGTSYASVAAGGYHSCGITTGGVLKCWGLNTNGQLGDGTTTQNNSPVIVDGGTSYSSVAAGGSHSCGITTGGALKCWGWNSSGQLGDGTTTQRTSPVTVNGGTNYSSVAAGGDHSCGITVANVLKCWGYNSRGQVGDGTTTQRTLPVVVDGGTSYSNVSLGGDHSCGITVVNALKCWGGGNYGKIGDGGMTDRYSPVLIDGGTNYSSVAAGGDHSCGITVVNALKCWGLNNSAQVGSGENYLSPWTHPVGF